MAMNRQELRVELAWFCGCGDPQAAAERLLHLLRLHPMHDVEKRGEFEAEVPRAGYQYLLLYHLDDLGLTEHGGSVGGGWLTAKGEAVRDALAAEEGDGFETLMGPSCVHGFDFDDETHDCMATDRGGNA